MGPFVQAEPFIPCLDRWPPGTLTRPRERAYTAQMKAGNINGLAIRKQPGNITVAQYLSNCPHPWILDQLRMTVSGAAVQIMIGDLA